MGIHYPTPEELEKWEIHEAEIAGRPSVAISTAPIG